MQVVRGFSTVPSISLINVEGTGMMGVPGIANRIFGALKEVQVSLPTSLLSSSPPHYLLLSLLSHLKKSKYLVFFLLFALLPSPFFTVFRFAPALSLYLAILFLPTYL
jgi:hypothetical protein